MAGPTDNTLNTMLGARGRPLTLEESKFLFRISVESAATTGPLRGIRVRHLTVVAFGVGLLLGAFPAARRAVSRLAANYFARQQQPPQSVVNPLAGLTAGERLSGSRR